MKNAMKIAAAFALVSAMSVAHANSLKCNHRVGSAQNDLFRDTNPEKTVAKKETTKEQQRRGKR